MQVPCPAVKEVEEITDFYMEVNSGSNCTTCLSWGYVGEEYRFQIETFDKKHGNHNDGVDNKLQKLFPKAVSYGITLVK